MHLKDMDISRATLISRKMFAHEHEALSALIQVTTASLWYLEKQSTGGNAPALPELFEDLPYWGHPPIAKMDSASKDRFTTELARLGIIRVISSFDHYITSLSAELSSIASAVEIIKESAPESSAGISDDEKPPRFITFAKRIGFKMSEEQETLGTFINVLRNCCAHRAGYASPKLVAMLAEPRVASLLIIQSNEEGKKSWKVNFPQLRAGDKIVLSPVHAIWASGVYFTIAKDIEAFVINQIGPLGLLRSAIYNLPKSYRLGKGMNTFETPQAAMLFMLSQMRITGIKDTDIIKILKKEEIWIKTIENFDKIEA